MIDKEDEKAFRLYINKQGPKEWSRRDLRLQELAHHAGRSSLRDELRELKSILLNVTRIAERYDDYSFLDRKRACEAARQALKDKGE